MSFDLNDLKRRMSAAVDVLQKEFAGLRAGRASTAMLEPVRVDAYGSMTPLSQVASIGAPEARLLTVQVWDRGLVKAVEKAIADANLGVNPAVDGQLIRVPLPELTQQRRQELGKVAAKYAEEAKIVIRNIRRDGIDVIKKMEKDKQISEDDMHRMSKDVQEETDAHVKRVDEMLAAKNKDIMQV